MPTVVPGDCSPDLDTDLYGSAVLSRPVPKYRFPAEEIPAREAAALVEDELLLDGNARLNLATFCTTWVEPEVTAILARCFDKNMVDKDEYPQTAEIESRCTRMLADLWHAPDASGSIGTSTTGSSEAAMLGGLAAKWRWRKARKQAGKDASRPNLVCGSVQICWEKFALSSSTATRTPSPSSSPSVRPTPGCTSRSRRSALPSTTCSPDRPLRPRRPDAYPRLARARLHAAAA